MAKMLIGTDGSKFSEKAANYGISIAKKLGYEVIGLYVINLKSLEIYAIEHHDDISGYESENRRYREEGEAALSRITDSCKEAGVKVSTVMVRGYPAEDILKLAESEKVNMIVVGNLGKTNLEYMFMGSISETVVKRANCPVLVVRGDVVL